MESLFFNNINIMHWFIDPIKNQYADFSGRTTRKAYWMFVLVSFIISAVLSIVLEIVNLDALIFVYYLAVLVPSISIATRRLHDTNKSGWWQLIGLIPILGLIILIVLLAKKTAVGPNNYDAAAAMPPVPPQDVPKAPTPEVVETDSIEAEPVEEKTEVS